jgi:hypothetical protein
MNFDIEVWERFEPNWGCFMPIGHLSFAGLFQLAFRPPQRDVDFYTLLILNEAK